MSRFAVCLNRVLKHEGGWSSHPADPGGDTQNGVTQRTYDDWRRKQGLSPRSVRNIGRAELEDIYLTYWKADLPIGVDYCYFDAAVNSGPRRAKDWLGLARRDDPLETITAFCAARLAFLRGLRTWRTFGKGWQRRVEEVQQAALSDALAARSTPEAVAFAPVTQSETWWKKVLSWFA